MSVVNLNENGVGTLDLGAGLSRTNDSAISLNLSDAGLADQAARTQEVGLPYLLALMEGDNRSLSAKDGLEVLGGKVSVGVKKYTLYLIEDTNSTALGTLTAQRDEQTNEVLTLLHNIADEKGLSLTTMYERIELVSSISERSIGHLQAAYKDKDDKAQNELGLYFIQGLEGFPQNDRLASVFFQVALNHDSHAALCSLGSCYLHGKGVTRDAEEAVNLFMRSINQEPTIPALMSIATCLYHGWGLPQDKAQAESIKAAVDKIVGQQES